MTETGIKLSGESLKGDSVMTATGMKLSGESLKCSESLFALNPLDTLEHYLTAMIFVGSSILSSI